MGTLAHLLALLALLFSPAEEPFKALSLADALTQAGAAKKVVMVDFFTTWCPPCKQLDAVTWKDERVRTWLAEHTVPLKLDAEKEHTTASKHKVSAYPTLLFLRPDGTELGRIVGFKGAEDFIRLAGNLLEGKSRVDELQKELAAAGGDDVDLRMELADELSNAGRGAEALEHYLWCWDHGLEHSKSFTGVRVSFMLSDIVSLGKKYPPALDALRERRDACEAAVKGGQLDYPLLRDFSALNRALDDEQGTLRLYDALMAREDLTQWQRVAVRMGLYDDVVDLLLEAGRYQDVLDGVKDYNAFVDQQIGMYNLSRALLKDNPEMAEGLKDNVVDECGKYYEALLGVGQLDAARALAERLIAFDGRKVAYEILIRHAKAAAGSSAPLKVLTADDEAASLRVRMKELPGESGD